MTKYEFAESYSEVVASITKTMNYLIDVANNEDEDAQDWRREGDEAEATRMERAAEAIRKAAAALEDAEIALWKDIENAA